MDENVLKRVMPHNDDAELSVLGSMLMDREAVGVAAYMLTPEDFYYSQNGFFFSAITDLYNENKPTDLITVQNKLIEKGAPTEITELSFVKKTVDRVPTSVNIKAYCEIVKSKAQLRRFIKTAQEIENSCYAQTKSVPELAEYIEKEVFEVLLRNGEKDPIKASDAAEMALNKIEEASKTEGRITGVESGFPLIDDITGGFQKGDLVIIAARPSMGKTAFALNIVEHYAIKKQKPCIMFSLEMNASLLMNRFFSMDSKIESTSLRNGKLNENEWDRLVQSVIKVSKGNLLIDDSTDITVNEMRSKCRKEKLKGGLDLIVVDYLQLVAGSKKNSENRQQEISEISRGLKALAREMDCPVIALSQLSRAPEGRMDHRPMLADLRESGSIEQDADTVMFLYRDDYYTKEECERPGETDVIIAKQRNGGLGDVTLMFNKENLKFYNMERR